MIDSDGKKLRFGFEFLGGLSGKQNLSNANKNSFSLDGHLYKLGSIDIINGFE